MSYWWGRGQEVKGWQDQGKRTHGHRQQCGD